eukprot:gene8722-6128_t
MAYLPTQLKKKDFRLPMVPGSTCGEEMMRRNYHRAHNVGAKYDCATQIPGVPEDLSAQNSKLPSVTASYANGNTASGKPGFGSGEEAEDLSGHVCRFYGYTIEPVSESPKETERVRKIILNYYLEDGTMSATEPKEDNSGIVYAGNLKRHLVPQANGSTITLDNLRIGQPITFYGQTYLIYDADPFTREFFRNKGIELPPAGSVPVDAFAAAKARPTRARDVPSIATTSSLNIMLSPEQVRATQQFLAHDREVLRCDCTWDDTESLYGVKHFLTLYYFLSDGSIALVEKETQNSGRDPFPNFFRRQKIAIPKDPNGRFDSSILGSVAFKEDKDTVYYSDKDIRIGNVLHLYNRKIVIHDYNQYTKEYLAKTYGITEYNPIPGAVPPPFVPPGAVHRELTEEELAQLKNKKVQEMRRRRFENSAVKFMAKMDNGKYEDEIRRFVITVFPADNTISIYEPVIRNSGIVGGKFLARQIVMHPDGKRPYRPDDLYVGARLLLNSHPFLFVACNENCLNYMEMNMEDFSHSDINKIVHKIQAMLRSKHTGLAEAFMRADMNNKTGLEMSVFLSIFKELGLDVCEQEILTVLRFFDKNGESYVSYEEVAARILPEGSRVASDDRPWEAICEESLRQESASFVSDPKDAERKRVVNNELELAARGAKELMELYDQRRQLFVKEFRTITDYAQDSLIGVDEFKRCIRQKLEIVSISDDELNALCNKLFTPSFERITFEEMHRLLKGTSSLSHNFKEIIAKNLISHDGVTMFYSAVIRKVVSYSHQAYFLLQRYFCEIVEGFFLMYFSNYIYSLVFLFRFLFPRKMERSDAPPPVAMEDAMKQIWLLNIFLFYVLALSFTSSCGIEIELPRQGAAVSLWKLAACGSPLGNAALGSGTGAEPLNIQTLSIVPHDSSAPPFVVLGWQGIQSVAVNEMAKSFYFLSLFSFFRYLGRIGMKLVFIFLSSMWLVLMAAADKSLEECERLGFMKDIVRCTDCDRLLFYTGSNTLLHECEACCSNRSSHTEEKATFTEAHIEYAGMDRVLRERTSTEIGLFYEMYKNEPYFPRLKFKQVSSVAIPRIVLRDTSTLQQASVQIAFWEAETIHDYLKERLVVVGTVPNNFAQTSLHTQYQYLCFSFEGVAVDSTLFVVFNRKPHPFDQIVSPQNRDYIEALLEQYETNKSLVDPYWHPTLNNILKAPKQAALVPAFSRPVDAAGGVAKTRLDNLRLAYMVGAYERHGHLRANIDPLGQRVGSVVRTPPSILDLTSFGFSESDRDITFMVSDDINPKMDATITSGEKPMTLGEIFEELNSLYCGSIGFEFMGAESLEIRNWFREQIKALKDPLPVEEKKVNYQDVVRACGFEKFLSIKYTTQHRFGLDGGEAFIPAINAALAAASEGGAEATVVGMAHRGRLNFLANISQKPLMTILNEFEGRVPSALAVIGGDVKYHMGMHRTITLRNGKKMDLDLLPNPSHLEAVNPVVLGKAYARQKQQRDKKGQRTLPLLIHGDAAYAGQGSCFETTAFHDVQNYGAGGTFHVVINNMIGFTANPQESRASNYCTDLAHINNNPVLHVNGDDVEACVRAATIAARFRQKFHQDVFLDIVCYRRFGHNEADLPDFTQPTLYRQIKNHPRLVDIYTQQLVKEGVITPEIAKEQDKEWEKTLRKAFETMADDTDYIKVSPAFDPKTGEMSLPGLKKPPPTPTVPAVETGVKMDILKSIGGHLASIPKEVKVPHPVVKRTYEARKAGIESGNGIEWGLGELLALATLHTQEKIPIRLTGEDVERGTFTHRHACVTDQVDNQKHFPIKTLAKDPEDITICNSCLSELGVAGFETGYNMANPKGIVMWEAQFGDFANGAQVIFDQFISCGEEKWNEQSSIILSLPHGYSGAGPEHSSARVERYLQLSDDSDKVPKDFRSLPDNQILENRIRRHNWQVTYPSTPASYFHILRRQGLRKFSKPLVNFFSKARLRAPNLSSLAEMADGTFFKPVIDTAPENVKARRVLFCSGQIESIVADGRKAMQKTKAGHGDDVVLVTLEQLAPFPWEQVASVIEKYQKRNPNVEFGWLQEEPRNMGMWYHMRPRFNDLLRHLKMPQKMRVISRRTAASPSTGYASVHAAEEKALITESLE